MNFREIKKFSNDMYFLWSHIYANSPHWEKQFHTSIDFFVSLGSSIESEFQESP